MVPAPEEQQLSGDVASLDIHLEPMDEQVSGVEDMAGSFLSPTPSSSSFLGFDKPPASPWDGSLLVRHKVKPLKKSKTKPGKSISSPALSPVPGPSTSADPVVAAKAPPPSKGLRGKSAKSKASAPDSQPDFYSDSLLSKVKEVVDERMEQNSALMAELKDMVAGLLRSGPQSAPAAVPDASKLPPFDKNNPWRFALHAPYLDSTLTIEGLGTRPLEDLEFYPHDLQFPFNGFVRLTENAPVRMDKVPKETVIFPKKQAQAVWARTLSDWGCSNSKLTPHKGAYTIFTTPQDIPSPLADKVAELTIQAAKDGLPMPTLKETDSTSLLMPASRDFWRDAPATFTVGKLDPDCASFLFSERLPKLPDHLLKTESETRSRLARSINSLISLELVSSLYKEEQIFRVLAKGLLQTFQIDLHDFWTARTNCRRHVLAEASIRHEPNRLIRSSCWGKNLFPQEEVDKVLQEAARANQNLQVRWGLSPKHKFDPVMRHQYPKKRQRIYSPYKSVRGQHRQSPAPPQTLTPSTSKSTPPQQFMIVPAPQSGQSSAMATWMTSPAFNQAYEASGTFRGYPRRQPGGNRARGQFRQRGGPRARGSRGGKGSKPTHNQ
ncbi:uncharacterized protein [Palaemon carinicauda]|uniref:uncharacterized protein n=1 Tax=Palaemon carinicauda TaxID=392227 RepID=UPI0035B69C77